MKAYINVQGSKAEGQDLLNKSWKVGKAKVNAGVKVFLCREAWWSTSTPRTCHWQQQVSIPRITPHWTPLWQRPCLPRAGCTCGDLQNEEPLCTARQVGSRAHSVMWFSDSQPSCLVITLTLINFKVQWWTKFRNKSHPCCNFCQKWPSATNLSSCVSVVKSLWSRLCKLCRKRREWLGKEPS